MITEVTTTNKHYSYRIHLGNKIIIGLFFKTYDEAKAQEEEVRKEFNNKTKNY
jgi:hypothetical protein